MEVTVAKAVLDHFAAKSGYLACYNTDPHYGHIPGFAQHNIRIGERYPDLLVLTPQDQVLAVEVKRAGGNVAEALGQALLYKDGTLLSYVALANRDADSIQTRALASGLGVISVAQDGRVQVEDPPSSHVPPHQHDLLRELRILLRHGAPGLRLTALQLNHPLHYFAPLLGPAMPIERKHLEAWLAAPEGWNFPPGSSVINFVVDGARALNLIHQEGTLLHLAPTGQLVRSLLLDGKVAWSHGEMRQFIGRRRLVTQQPFLASLVQIAFREVEDVRTVIEGLGRSQSDNILGVLAVLSMEYPNALLNIFVRVQYHPQVIRLINRRKFDDLLSPPFVREWLSSFSRFQLKAQLLHAGILESRPGVRLYDHRDSYDPRVDIWRLATPWRPAESATNSWATKGKGEVAADNRTQELTPTLPGP